MGCYMSLYNTSHSGQSIQKPDAPSRILGCCITACDAFMQRSGNNALLYKPIIMLDTAAKVFRSQMHLLEYWAAV